MFFNNAFSESFKFFRAIDLSGFKKKYSTEYCLLAMFEK